MLLWDQLEKAELLTRCQQVKWNIHVSWRSKLNWRSSQGLSWFCRFVKIKDKPSATVLLGFRRIVLLVPRESHTFISIVMSDLVLAFESLTIYGGLTHQHEGRLQSKTANPTYHKPAQYFTAGVPVQFPGNALAKNSSVWSPRPKTSHPIKATSAASPRGSMHLKSVILDSTSTGWGHHLIDTLLLYLEGLLVPP